MKSVRKNKSKLPIIIGCILAALIVLAAGYYLYGLQQNSAHDTSSSSSVDEEPATIDQSSAGSDIKKQALEQDAAEQDATKTTTSVEILPPTVSTNSVRIQSTIQDVSNTGTCTLTLTKDAVTKTYTAEVQALSSYSTCKGFTIPTSDLSSGTWAVAVNYTNGTTVGNATSEISL